MQTRSQTRKLLLDPKNVMFEIPVSSATPSATPRAKATSTPSAIITRSKAKAMLRKTASTRVLPDSMKGEIKKTIDCALFLPKYMQKPLYDVSIDFDEASLAWRANKTSIGNGEYKYKKQVHFENI